MAEDPYKYFRLEARELLDQLSAGILELDKGAGGPALVQRLLRVAHTLKGAARVVKQQEIADRAHAIEGALAPFRESASGPGRGTVDALLGHLDQANGQLRSIGQPGPAAAPEPGKPAPEESARAIRADVAELDAVLDGVTETHALLNGVRAAAEAVMQAQHLVDDLLAQVGPAGTGGGQQGPRGRPGRLQSLAEELHGRFGGIGRGLGSAVDQMERELRQLRDAAEQLRLVPAGDLFNVLERTARDSAAALARQVAFEGKGGQVRLDSHVLGTMQAALVQIVRNAVAHGIESPEDRRAAGKPPAGRVSVEVVRQGRRVLFRCEDDGRGVDLEAVRRIAQQRGLLGRTPEALSAEDLVRLLMQGGISTSAAVTTVAGRGVGLDVVREAVGRLDGGVNVRTRRGRGTTFELVVPPSLTSLEALVVEAVGLRTSIPLDAVRGSLRVAPGALSHGAAGSAIVVQEEAIPFLPLARALGIGTRQANRSWTAVVLAGEGGKVAIGVDRLLETARIVLRPLPENTSVSAVVAGASLDAEGNPQLVLDPEGLIAETRRGAAAEPEAPPARPPVLIVDDSLTTRMLEQSILEPAGYEVAMAQSAEEGLDMARRRRYALFLVDIEMPGMDGFTFIERIRADPGLRDIPAILVSSRAGPEDRRRGLAAGAQGYVDKGEFDQSGLLAMIKRLVG